MTTPPHQPPEDREPATTPDGEALPPRALEPKKPRTVRPESDKGSGQAPPEDIGDTPGPFNTVG